MKTLSYHCNGLSNEPSEWEDSDCILVRIIRSATNDMGIMVRSSMEGFVLPWG